MSERDGTGPDGLTDLERAAHRRTPAARASQALTEERRRATQAELAAAARKYSTAAGEATNRAGLASPLTDAELKTGDGYGVGITDVDCTPRPRYGESRERFEARMRSYGVELEVLQADVKTRNRRAALRAVGERGQVWRPEEVPAGEYPAKWFTQCACSWCGIRVDDPEVARREYDAHPCRADNLGDDAVTRAQAHAGKATMPARRTSHVLQPAVVERAEQEPVRAEVATDDTEQRMALLELDKA